MYPGRALLTLRDNTERPETLEVGSNVLAGADALRMVLKVKRILEQGNGVEESVRGWSGGEEDQAINQQTAKFFRDSAIRT